MTDNDLWTRRQLFQHGITASFALAVAPATAKVISTPSDGLLSDTISIPCGKDSMPAYWAMPKGNGPFPVVLVIQEIFGVHAYIQDICRRLAKEGYLAIAPYFYFRQGDVTKMKDIPQIISEVVSKVPQKQVWEDIDSTMKWLKKNSKADTTRTAITGFCWGGNVVWMYAAHNPKVRAGVAWYGRVTGKPDGKTLYPVGIAPTLQVPVLGLYGEKDHGISADDISTMREALKKSKTKHEIIVYPGAEHGFHADYRPSYQKAAAEDGWKRMLAWFKKNGV